MQVKPTSIAIAMVLALQSAHVAANDTNAERCRNLDAEIKRQYEASVSGRMPSSSPGTYVQETADIEKLLRVDVSAGLSKLLNLDFGSIMNMVLKEVTQTGARKASELAASKLRSAVSSIAPPSMSGQMNSYLNSQVNSAIGRATQQPVSTTPYGR